MAHVTPEGFEEFVDGALEPADYPGDEMTVPLTDDDAEVAWRIRDEGSAAWALRRRARSLGEIRKARALADEQIRQIEAYVVSVEKDHDRTASYFEGKLREYYETVWLPNRPGKGFTCKLPGGRIASNAGSLRTEVDDPAAALAWFEAHGVEECIRRRDPEPAADAIKARFRHPDDEAPGEYRAVVRPDDPDIKSRRKSKPEPGEIIPGVKFVRGARTFKIEEAP